LFRQSAISRNEDPGFWIRILEEQRMKLEDRVSVMTDDQSMIHVPKNLSIDYEIKMVLLEKRIENNSNLHEVNELHEELNQQYGRLYNQNESNKESKANEEQALFTPHFKGDCRNWGKIGHNANRGMIPVK
jgi:hypothetical protein